MAAAADPALVSRLAERQTTLEVCPASNVALGVAATPADVPLIRLLDAGIRVALGADDPLLFGSRLTAQYELARGVHGLTDDRLAELARMSVLGSAAPADVRGRLCPASTPGWPSQTRRRHPGQQPADLRSRPLERQADKHGLVC